MITAGTAAASESWPVYSNFRQEVNFHCDQNQYKQIIRNQSQSFYSTQSYHVVKDINFDNKNIYHVNSDQEKLKQSESDSKDYFADHVDIFDLKTRICQFC